MFKTLTAPCFVTADGFSKAYPFGTVRTFYSKDNLSPEELEAKVARNADRGHRYAWSINSGSTLYGDPEAARHARWLDAFNKSDAVILVDGEHVIIDGREFVVKVNGERYSDPIAFNEVGVKYTPFDPGN